MKSNEPELPLPNPPTEDEVTQWLLAHPDFLLSQPELLVALTPPQAQGSDAVEDFQFHMLKRLQDRQKELKEDLEELITVTRDNISTQEQVQKAVISLLKANNLQQLIQCITDDLPTLFHVDVVRIALETPLADHFPTNFSEESYSGIAALPVEGVDAAIGLGQQSFAIFETRNSFPEATKEVFDACSGLIRSCILLRFVLPKAKRQGILAFGVRYAGRFHEGQSSALLNFLSEVVALRLEPLLEREALDEF
jgi:uncharacterized protein YigA (DUF484 family)